MRAESNKSVNVSISSANVLSSVHGGRSYISGANRISVTTSTTRVESGRHDVRPLSALSRCSFLLY